ncbi:hypothetical protein [Streptomyces sp. NPDC086838]|uniref:hypothetical protein n=1 Tax=Streptomyces sp. NPDC086838 TaxID=3365762 RepID=UPI00380ADC9F
MAHDLPTGTPISDEAQVALASARNRAEYEQALRQVPACLYPDRFGRGTAYYEKTAHGHLFLRNTPTCTLDATTCPEGRPFFDYEAQDALFAHQTTFFDDGSDPDPKAGQIY